MKVIFISDDGAKYKKIHLNKGLQFLLPFLVLVITVMLLRSLLIAGFAEKPATQALAVQLSPVSSDFSEQVSKLSTLKAQVDRLNALGAYLAKQEDIDIDQFMLQAEPALGGFTPSSHYLKEVKNHVSYDAGLSHDISQLEGDIAVQESQYFSLKTALEYKNLENKALQIFRMNKDQIELISEFALPVTNGYTSSGYGPRRDPISGKHRNHRGIDIAAPKGTEIKAFASGFVSFIGRKGGYGNTLEIQHSDSLKSRYAHLHSFNVKLGQVVRKGDKVAEVGSTGRVTGPHLHLEVWKNNKTVDPMSYLEP